MIFALGRDEGLWYVYSYLCFICGLVFVLQQLPPLGGPYSESGSMEGYMVCLLLCDKILALFSVGACV